MTGTAVGGLLAEEGWCKASPKRCSSGIPISADFSLSTLARRRG